METSMKTKPGFIKLEGWQQFTNRLELSLPFQQFYGIINHGDFEERSYMVSEFNGEDKSTNGILHFGIKALSYSSCPGIFLKGTWHKIDVQFENEPITLEIQCYTHDVFSVYPTWWELKNKERVAKHREGLGLKGDDLLLEGNFYNLLGQRVLLFLYGQNFKKQSICVSFRQRSR